jgi:hypothetical protein
LKPLLFTIVIPSRRVADLLCDAFEGESKTWVSASEPIGRDPPEGHSTPWYDDESFVQSEAFRSRSSMTANLMTKEAPRVRVNSDTKTSSEGSV